MHIWNFAKNALYPGKLLYDKGKKPTGNNQIEFELANNAIFEGCKRGLKLYMHMQQKDSPAIKNVGFLDSDSDNCMVHRVLKLALRLDFKGWNSLTRSGI